MTRDQMEPPLRKPPQPGRMVLTGVVGACLLGVALGFWARPAEPGEPGAHRAAKAKPAAPPRVNLQIVVDNAPAPVGSPLEVLPADPAPARSDAAAPPAEPMMVPRRPASGLVKVDALVAPEPEFAPEPAPIVRAAPKPRAQPPKKLETLKLVVVEKPRVDPRVAKAKIAEARAAEARLADAKAQKTFELAQARAEKLEKARAVRLANAEKAEKLEKAEKARAMKLAKAEAQHARKPDKVAKLQVKTRPQAQPKNLTALLRAVKAEARQIVRPKAVKVAAIKPAPKPERVAAKPATRRIVRGGGPVRVARADVCASPDPGEAIVCADSRLGARDRQLQDAYRTAEAAGVPANALRRQQSRWLAARAAAAREAPWAVEDVYVARISELRDQTRDAREN